MNVKVKKNGAPGGNRTPDPLLRRQTLYPLSYGRVIPNFSYYKQFRHFLLPRGIGKGYRASQIDAGGTIEILIYAGNPDCITSIE